MSLVCKYLATVGTSSGRPRYQPFSVGGYPDSNSNLYCLTCHFDHDVFNSNKAARHIATAE